MQGTSFLIYAEGSFRDLLSSESIFIYFSYFFVVDAMVIVSNSFDDDEQIKVFFIICSLYWHKGIDTDLEFHKAAAWVLWFKVFL